MQFGQEEELVRHGADRIDDGPCCVAPVNSYPLAFKYRVIGEIRARVLMVVIRQEGEQAVRVGITVPKLDNAMIGGEALDCAPCRGMFWDDPQEDVIMHEPVHWWRVAHVAVHQDTKVITPVVVVWRDQCVGLFVLPTVLQLQELQLLCLSVKRTLTILWASDLVVRSRGRNVKPPPPIAISQYTTKGKP